jgi:peptidoglycan-N-acetylmuramic acid deacetylase
VPGDAYYWGIDLSGLSNKKIGWGVKLNGNKQPEVPKAMVETLDKYGAIYMGGADDKSIYLTIDQGYENGYTPPILDALKANGVKCVFFITGDYLNRNADLVRRMLDEGHIVGNHTDKHTSLPGDSIDKVRKELKDLNDRFYEAYGINMKYMRPPMGEYSERVLAICAQEGYAAVMWSLTYADYDVNKQRGEAYAYNKLMDNLHSGAVILLHAVSKDNANVMDRFLKDAMAKGYRFKLLDDFTR